MTFEPEENKLTSNPEHAQNAQQGLVSEPQGNRVGDIDTVQEELSLRPDGKSPEPPPNWTNDTHPAPVELQHVRNSPYDNGQQVLGNTPVQIQPDSEHVRSFNSARKFVIGAQICAIVSLFIGGIVLSAVSVVLAVIGYRTVSALANEVAASPTIATAYKRSAAIAILMTVLALVVNIASIVLFMPMIMEALQQGDLTGMLSSVASPDQPASTPASPSSGDSLFG